MKHKLRKYFIKYVLCLGLSSFITTLFFIIPSAFAKKSKCNKDNYKQFIYKPGYHRCDLRDANFEGMNFEDANFGGANLERTKFGGAIVKGADFSGTTLWDADLKGLDFDRTKLHWASFRGAKLKGVKFTGADASRAFITDVNLDGVDLSGGTFVETSFKGTDLSGVKDITGASMSGAWLSKTDFSGLDVSTVNFNGARFTRWVVEPYTNKDKDTNTGHAIFRNAKVTKEQARQLESKNITGFKIKRTSETESSKSSKENLTDGPNNYAVERTVYADGMKFTNCTDYLSEPLYIKVGKCDAHCKGKLNCDYHLKNNVFPIEIEVVCKEKKTGGCPNSIDCFTEEIPADTFVGLVSEYEKRRKTQSSEGIDNTKSSGVVK